MIFRALGLLTALASLCVVVDCSGSSGTSRIVQSPSATTTVSPSNVSSLSFNPLFGKKIKFVNGPKARPATFPFLKIRRTPQASVTTAGEEQIAGQSYSPVVNLPTTGEYANGASLNLLINASTSLPEPSAGTNWYAIRDIIGSNSCIEIDTIYQRSAGDASTSMALGIQDTCSGAQTSIPMDSAFFSTYGIPNSASLFPNPNVSTPGTDGLQIYIYSGYNGPNWSVLLQEYTGSSQTQVLDDVYDSQDLATTYSNIMSYIDINSFAVGPCPFIPTQQANVFTSENAQLGPASANYFAPSSGTVISPTNVQNPSAPADCFQSTPDVNPYYAFYPGNEAYNERYYWSLSTLYTMPTPTPSPSVTPTPTPTPSPSPVPTATPTPMPTPTPLPSPLPSPSPTPVPTPTGSTYINVIVNTPTLTAPVGQVSSFNCVFTIQSADGVHAKYNVTDWGAGTSSSGSSVGFPVLNYPQNSDVSWSVDSSTTYKILSDSGAPGQTTYTVNPSAPQTHCINLEITVPASQAAGTYPATIQYNVYGSKAGQNLEVLVASAQKTVDVVVP